MTWFAGFPCSICGASIGDDGVFLAADIQFCRVCARRVRQAIDAWGEGVAKR